MLLRSANGVSVFSMALALTLAFSTTSPRSAVGGQEPAPSFTEVAAGFPALAYGSAVWGDYDGDGDLDLHLTGFSGSGNVSVLYRNDGGSFVDAVAGLPAVSSSAAAWGDYDNDGDLDLALTGHDGAARLSRIYRNDGGSFVDIEAGLLAVAMSAVGWGDYDNDGDLDLLLTGGDAGFTAVTRLYRNDDGAFVEVSTAIVGVMNSVVNWVDYDNDGDLDISLAGYPNSGSVTRIYRNDAGAFVDSGASLPGIESGALEWGDYDNDGDLDLFLSGFGLFTTRLYRNNNGSLVQVTAALVGGDGASAAWGDCDNDGDLDLIVAAYHNDKIARTLVYRNDGGSFVDLGAVLEGASFGSADWVDFDGDGDLDILLTGITETNGFVTKLYENDLTSPNNVPSAPSGLSATPVDDGATFSWVPATDAETPTAGLSYNLRVGRTPGGSEVVSPLSSTGDGFRRVVGLGNTQQNTMWTLDLDPGTYYWSVQAVDGAWSGSPFAAEEILNHRTSGVSEESLSSADGPKVFPSPVRGSATLALSLDSAGPVRVDLYNVAGRLVRTLVDRAGAAGTKEIPLETANGTALQPGLYLYRATAPGSVQRGRFVVLE